jgi:hypothetical protein
MILSPIIPPSQIALGIIGVTIKEEKEEGPQTKETYNDDVEIVETADAQLVIEISDDESDSSQLLNQLLNGSQERANDSILTTLERRNQMRDQCFQRKKFRTEISEKPK